MASDHWLIVGLGNPGPKYAGTRHNAGFLVVDLLAERMGGAFKAHKGRADLVQGRWGDVSVLVMKPKCYMNESGGPVAAVRDFFKVAPERIVVVHDELDLPFGALRLKVGGGDGGHNGLKSLTRSLGTNAYHRVRFGIDRPPGRMDPAAYVLKDFSATEHKELGFFVDRAADATQDVVARGLEYAQNTYN